MTTVVLDTNALMMPVECGVRVFEELDRVVVGAEPVTPAAVVDELERLSESNGAEGTAASVGLDLAGRCRVVETTASYADDAVVELAETGADGGQRHVVTNDRPLATRLRERGVRVIGLRGENTLAVTEP
ncbi:PIN domain-containing protein [Candidatus Halobonum tyrrellensis]|uniref:SSU processome protein utp24 n=1 Tax=Candidatus Halobonum tyrrellensis G22 TaxID=1324957 RepID=V4J180_9EURY|nr:PIN domain-containing protein [Candidatus Halobonum tyrrellensis]ESP89207.1 SSU processome protein utp24 [Candidatus Halobonum tyrrellensis G22]